MEDVDIRNIFNGLTVRAVEILRDVERRQKGDAPFRYGRSDAAFATGSTPGQARGPMDQLAKNGLLERHGGSRKLAALTRLTEKGRAILEEMRRRWGTQQSVTATASSQSQRLPVVTEPTCRDISDIRDVALRRAITAAGPVIEREVRTAIAEQRELDRGVILSALSAKDADTLVLAVGKHYQPNTKRSGTLGELLNNVIGLGRGAGDLQTAEQTVVPIPVPRKPIHMKGTFPFNESTVDGKTRCREVDAAVLEPYVNGLLGETDRIGVKLSKATASQVVYDLVFGRGAELGSIAKRIRCALRLVRDGRWHAPLGYTSSFADGLRSVVVA